MSPVRRGPWTESVPTPLLLCVYCGRPATTLGHLEDWRDAGHRPFVDVPEQPITSKTSQLLMESPARALVPLASLEAVRKRRRKAVRAGPVRASDCG